MKQRNPVAKNLWKYNKKKVQESKKKYTRKAKHAQETNDG
jgi:hypothetical protein